MGLPNFEIDKVTHMFFFRGFILSAAIIFYLSLGCRPSPDSENPSSKKEIESERVVPEFYLFRPDLEKKYGYSHAVKIGNDIRISGAVSMDSAGNLIAPGNLEQQMKNCYGDLQKILAHYGCTFDDVIFENVFTTNMQEFIRVAGYRNTLYKKHFPGGDWLEVKGLALPGQLIEIDLEVRKPS